MNQSEDLALKLQTVKLAIAEVEEQNFDSEKQKNLKISALNKIENAILLKSKELKIDIEAA